MTNSIKNVLIRKKMFSLIYLICKPAQRVQQPQNVEVQRYQKLYRLGNNIIYTAKTNINYFLKYDWVLGYTLIWWRDSDAGDLRCVKYTFISVTLRSTLAPIGCIY